MKTGQLAVIAKTSPRVIKAAVEFIQLKDRMTNPGGTFDNAKRWYPDTFHTCCRYIRSPSRAYPYSYLVHCRTAGHVANDFNVDEKLLRSVATCFSKAGVCEEPQAAVVIEADKHAYLAKIVADAKALKAKAAAKARAVKAKVAAKAKAAKAVAKAKAKAKAAKAKAAEKAKAAAKARVAIAKAKSTPRRLVVAI